MKKIFDILMLALVALTLHSCLKTGLDELPTYDEAEITNVRFEYRWWDEAIKQARVVELGVEKTIDAEKGEINCTITIPASNDIFTESIRSKVSLANIVCSFDISTGARVISENGAPKLGVPTDFSAKKFDYLLIAANGNEKLWKLNITEMN